ncbi:MAG: peptide chain release factor N(5)-glutamine methyltransferase [Anaerolineaceae bacterium]|nr:peptide chain release factor N(5)-glutamine methyltransferase [Anaerolineaceae bacterium]
MTDLRSWLQHASAQLNVISDTPALDAQVLLADFLQQPRTWILAHNEEILNTQLETALNEALSQLVKGMPLPYLIGHWEFFGLDFAVTPDVLIPRPETELLVETALEWLQDHPQRRLAADVGTGSGCIAVSLAKQVGDLSVTAVDISRQALDVATQNVAAHAVEDQVRLVQGSLMQPLQGRFDLICSNPPYIPSEKLAGLAVAKHEPHLALDGGADGLNAIITLLNDAPRVLAPGGLMLIEIESSQGEAVLDLAHEILPKYLARVLPDLAGLPRLLCMENED